jgi:hypothetical protein
MHPIPSHPAWERALPFYALPWWRGVACCGWSICCAAPLPRNTIPRFAYITARDVMILMFFGFSTKLYQTFNVLQVCMITFLDNKTILIGHYESRHKILNEKA